MLGLSPEAAVALFALAGTLIVFNYQQRWSKKYSAYSEIMRNVGKISCSCMQTLDEISDMEFRNHTTPLRTDIYGGITKLREDLHTSLPLDKVFIYQKAAHVVETYLTDCHSIVGKMWIESELEHDPEIQIHIQKVCYQELHSRTDQFIDDIGPFIKRDLSLIPNRLWLARD